MDFYNRLRQTRSSVAGFQCLGILIDFLSTSALLPPTFIEHFLLLSLLLLFFIYLFFFCIGYDDPYGSSTRTFFHIISHTVFIALASYTRTLLHTRTRAQRILTHTLTHSKCKWYIILYIIILYRTRARVVMWWPRTMCHFADVSSGDRQKIRIYLYSIHVRARFRNFAEFRLVDDFDNASVEKKYYNTYRAAVSTHAYTYIHVYLHYIL